MGIEKGYVVDYVDERGDTHEAKVVQVIIQPPSISNPKGSETTLCTVEYEVLGRTRRAELISDKPNAGGVCYKNPRKGEAKPEPTPETSDESEMEDKEEPEINTTPDATAPEESKPESS